VQVFFNFIKQHGIASSYYLLTLKHRHSDRLPYLLQSEDWNWGKTLQLLQPLVITGNRQAKTPISRKAGGLSRAGKLNE